MLFQLDSQMRNNFIRGLSKQQAMGLLSVGYFLPVLDLVEDKELYESLRTYMESKVGLYGRQ